MTQAVRAVDDSRLRALGWTASLEQEVAGFGGSGYRRARVVIDFGVDLAVRTVAGEERAQLSPELYRDARGGDRVVVGDWVLLAGEPGRAEIVHRLGRRSRFSRRRPGAGPAAEQVIAANVDVAFIVTDAADFNVRRIERYVALVNAARVRPVILLSKLDLDADVREQVAELSSAAPGVPVHPVSSRDGQGLGELARYLTLGRTVCLLGSSGVGKSTLLNRLLGRERLKTQATRRDGSGRHTTSHRELVRLPAGAVLIDNPGMREVGLVEGEHGSDADFSDISALAVNCRFSDCNHDAEPGCAVLEACETGALAVERLAGFRRLAREAAFPRESRRGARVRSR
jgi:ribosome biogenesis GTPase / thiamine phosphate phosphatase